MQKKVLIFPWTKGELDFLIYCPMKLENNPLPDWLPDIAWNAIQKLIDLPEFETFAKDLKDNPGRFKDWYNDLTPEIEKLPLEWKRLESMPF